MTLPINTTEVEAMISRVLAQRRIPGATYRLQFNADFTLRHALELVPYLHDLGITDVYASPLFKARPGSTHSYDVVDYSQLNPLLGSEADFDALVDALQRHGMGLLLDIVPNHMGIGPDNAWWMDVLEHGPASPYARYFDINWHPAQRSLENKVLLPILEDHYGRVLEVGKLRLVYEGDRFLLDYNGFRLPLTVTTWTPLLALALDALDAGSEEALEGSSIVLALRRFPRYEALDPRDTLLYMAEERVIRRRLAALMQHSPQLPAVLTAVLAHVNNEAGDADGFEVLDEVIAGQFYDLAYWRVAADEINYRRFFDINDMAAVRTEFPEVFEATHRKLFQWLADGKVTGVRVDHPDGLYDPTTYFLRLQDGFVRTYLARHTDVPTLAELTASTLFTRFRQTNHIDTPWPLYVLAEKILSETEPLPHTWALDGTTGYDFMIAVNGIFVNRDQVHAFNTLYSRFINAQVNYRAQIYHFKRLIMDLSLASEINARSQQLFRLLQQTRRYRNFTLNRLTFAIREIIACLPIYRTYITEPGDVSERDRHYLDTAVSEAKRRNPRALPHVFDFLHRILLLENLYEFDEGQRSALIEFVMQFQQITGPVMAKSVEDTVFYNYNRLVSLNEVGGNPEQFGIGLEDFHEHNRWHIQHWPHTMLSTSTHDTKRSEDVRARLNVLSEIPGEWEAAIWRWHHLNASAKTGGDGEAYPSKNDEYLLYQAMLGIWEAQRETLPARLVQYMVKAANEAKAHTSWTNANVAYEAALETFIERIFANEAFLEDFAAFHRRVACFGCWNALSQTLLKLTAPGVPDIYQGTELWDYSLVDPDNRRPVDYDLRRRSLDAFLAKQTPSEADLRALVRDADDGQIKLWLIAQTLRFRRDHRAIFDDGTYQPLAVRGEKAGHVFAFCRETDAQRVIVAVPVLVTQLTGYQERPPLGADVWRDTALVLPDSPIGSAYRHVLTGEHFRLNERVELPLAEIFRTFPVALLAPSA